MRRAAPIRPAEGGEHNKRINGRPAIELGFFTMPVHPLERVYVDVLREDREAIILADRLGFSEAFVGEHITDPAEAITSSMLFLATLIHATRTIKLGTGTVNMSYTHPAITAANVAMLDNLLEGRFLFGISPGALASDAEALGLLGRNRTEMMVEAINLVLAIWDGEPPYNLKGENWSITTETKRQIEVGTGAIPKPYQKPHPPILGTVVEPFSKGVVELGARGWYPISANFLLPKWVASHWPLYAEGGAREGREADPAVWRIAKSVFVCKDENKALAYGKDDSNSPYRFYYDRIIKKTRRAGRLNLFKPDPGLPDEYVVVDQALDDLVICGGVDSVVDQLLAFRETTGDFGTLLYAGHDWVDEDLSRRSMELMAAEVMPRVNKAIGQSTAAAREPAPAPAIS